MARSLKHHHEIVHGVGRCSVPMWRMGVPAGFCDKPAYGERPPGEERRAANGEVFRLDGRYSGYVPGLACRGHGGPTLAEAIKGRTVIRFDGPPGPEAGRFVEVERDGASIAHGTWIRDGENWLLVLPEATEVDE